MSFYFPAVDKNVVHLRQRDPPLFQMPHMWQPNLNMPNPYHSSHCDRIQQGWRKWGAEQPDWYARRADAQCPDWYARRVNTIRQADTKEQLWPWEQTSKPTERRVYGLGRESPRPVQRGYQAVPHEIEGQVAMPRWGLSHPHHYEEPSRVGPLPPVHADEKHLRLM